VVSDRPQLLHTRSWPTDARSIRSPVLPNTTRKFAKVYRLLFTGPDHPLNEMTWAESLALRARQDKYRRNA